MLNSIGDEFLIDGENMDIPMVNIQALVAGAFFLIALFVSRIVANIYKGKWSGGAALVVYLRMLIGFLLTGAVVLAFYSFAGVDVISKYL